MTIRAAYGINQLHLGQPVEDVVKAFGVVDRRRLSGSLREYWIFHRAGFECIVSRKTGRILSLFFHRDLAESPIEEFKWTEKEVARHYTVGLRGGGLSIGDEYFDRWESFDDGIGFQFDKAGRVKVISVFAKRRRSKAKTVAEPSGRAVHDLAA